MLDKRCIALLNVICTECAGSEYKIFSLDELSALMPVHLSLAIDGLREALFSLDSHEYISIKYQDDSEVCLRPLIKGRVEIENKSDKEQSELMLERKVLVFSFLGGVLGGILSGLIVYLIKLLGGV